MYNDLSILTSFRKSEQVPHLLGNSHPGTVSLSCCEGLGLFGQRAHALVSNNRYPSLKMNNVAWKSVDVILKFHARYNER